MTAEPLDLEPIRARADAATLGPWTAEHGRFGTLIHAGRTHLGPLTVASVPNRRDAEFVTAARSDVPALIAEVERLRADVARLDAELEERYESGYLEGQENS